MSALTSVARDVTNETVITDANATGTEMIAGWIRIEFSGPPLVAPPPPFVASPSPPVEKRFSISRESE